jgi:hypothetical protein
MRTVEIVTHCYCPPGVDQYAEHLKWQFASLFLHAEGPVIWSVCYTDTDHATRDRLETCMDMNSQRGDDMPKITVNPIRLDRSHLFRRAIGRNVAAKASTADVVWFTDVDYCFGQNCLYIVQAKGYPARGLFKPKTVTISKTHLDGAQMIYKERGNDLPDVHKHEDAFTRDGWKGPAIGGVQIVGGELAREHGYLDGNEKWQTPVNPDMGFRSCRADPAFRRKHQPVESVQIPHVFRIRHIEDGRDFTEDGHAIGKSAW